MNTKAPLTHLYKLYRQLRGILEGLYAKRKFRQDFLIFQEKTQRGDRRFIPRWKERYPCMNDRTDQTDYDHHYIYHTAWAARVVQRISPEVHYDFSSLLIFNTILSAFVPVVFHDFRPAICTLDNITSKACDLLRLPYEDGSLSSISCLHTIEHIGLGRYGDALEPDGDIRAMKELVRVLAPSGSLLIAVPIGSPRLLFNAHRIYAYRQICEYFHELQLVEFSLVTDRAGDSPFIVNAAEETADAQDYGCGCFWFRKAG